MGERARLVKDKLALGGQQCSVGDFQQVRGHIKHEPKRYGLPRAWHVEFGITRIEMKTDSK